ncbi:hypothetical protein SPLC1_S501180 [Arthrospira platensis C1]|nr:hypothetical protein SPLC1_S501180 [Arthrospira platensis C1]
MYSLPQYPGQTLIEPKTGAPIWGISRFMLLTLMQQQPEHLGHPLS